MSDSASGFADLVALRIDKNDPIAVYQQIARAISGMVREETVSPGTRLPPERVMCEILGVSKMTLRQAYSVLERASIIASRRGVGTVISHPPVDKNLPEMRSFSEEMVSRGKQPSSRFLRMDITAPSLRAAELLNLADGQKVYRIQRLRLADSQPITIETVELPADWLPHLQRFDLQAQSLYKVLEDHYGIRLGKCREEISAMTPTAAQRKLLQIGRSVAVLVINRQSFAVNGSPIEVSESVYRGDMYTASIEAIRIRNDSIPAAGFE